MRTALSRRFSHWRVRSSGSSALLGLALIALLSGCGGTREVMLSEPSPDGSRTAYVVQVNSGGATAGFEYEVIVAPSQGDFDAYAERNWVWRSYRMPPTRIAWQGRQSVEVEVVEDAHYADMIQVREVQGIRASTATVPRETAPQDGGQSASDPS